MNPILSRLSSIISALLLTVLFIYIIAKEPSQLKTKDNHQLGQSISIGAGLYELHCRTCHGVKGEGVGQLGPALNDSIFFTERLKEVGWQDTMESYILASIAHGRIIATRPKYAGNTSTAVMNPWLDDYGGPLRMDQIKDITNYILNWKATALGEVELKTLKIPEPSLNDSATIAKGKTVFLSQCKECHIINGLNTATKKGPNLSGIAEIALTRNSEIKPEQYIRESVLIPTEIIVKGFEPDTLGYQCGGVLSKKQLDEVTAFLLSHK
jgi:mono/diheme cytochrome c family protein